MENYTQIKILGKGAFGSAWLVQRNGDKAQLVAKEVRLTNMKPAERESAKHEISMLRKLDHPNITHYVDHFEHRGSLYIVMEYANGGDLYTKIKSQGGVRFTEKEILHYFSQISLALLHLHHKRILHRDLKSQNVFLTQDGIVKLGDFGISTVLRNTCELKRTVCGTPYYFSPELCMNKPYNNKSDVWALGCILYELTTLNHAFDGSSMKALVQKILKGVYPPIHSSYSPNLAKLVAATLKLDPVRRPNVHEIVSSPYIREHLVGMKVDVEQANKDKRSCVDDGERRKAQELARKRQQEDASNMACKVNEMRGRAQQQEADKAKRIEDLRKQMEIRQREHEEQLRRIKDQQAAQEAANAEKKKGYEIRIREQKKLQQERAVKQAGLLKQREEDWERNLLELKKQREMQSPVIEGGFGGGNDVKDNRQTPCRHPPVVGYDANSAAKAYREMRREAEENRRRAEQDIPQVQQYKPPSPPPTPLHHKYPPDEPVKKKPMTEAEMEEARKKAFWEMRLEAEENKKRLLGLHAAENQQMIPQKRISRPVSSSPVSQPLTPKQVNGKLEKRADNRIVVNKHMQPLQLDARNLEDDIIEEEDEDIGYHKFLNNEVAAQEDDANRAAKREQEYNAMTKVLNDAIDDKDSSISGGRNRNADFDDPMSEGADPSKFVLDGQTLHLPNCAGEHPLMSRMESLRIFLESALGADNFLKAYRIMDGVTEDDDEDSFSKVESYLPKSQHRFIPVIAQLIVCEEYFNQQGNN
eukprot:Tbor_TRINITY_DN5954_c4_g1::TRINITY_DN5954_c4_g1_i3::g.19319::m.19319/K08857/NEK1_4_5; NIMA (never in mitosis gene a)-related kinase 1/4/5